MKKSLFLIIALFSISQISAQDAAKLKQQLNGFCNTLYDMVFTEFLFNKEKYSTFSGVVKGQTRTIQNPFVKPLVAGLSIADIVQSDASIKEEFLKEACLPHIKNVVVALAQEPKDFCITITSDVLPSIVAPLLEKVHPAVAAAAKNILNIASKQDILMTLCGLEAQANILSKQKMQTLIKAAKGNFGQAVQQMSDEELDDLFE